MSVLVIAHDRPSRDALCAILVAEGLHPHACQTAEDALRSADAGPARCMLVVFTQDARRQTLETIRTLAAGEGGLPIIAISEDVSADTILDAIRAGARDYLTLPVQVPALRDALHRQIARCPQRTQPPFSPSPPPLPPAFSLLSEREREVLDWVVRGHSTKQIAARLGRVEKTVEYHRKRIMEKLGVNTAVQLVRLATLHGWGLEQQETQAQP